MSLPQADKVDLLRAIACSLGRALHEDDPAFWDVVAALNEDFPEISWHNSMTDSGSKSKPL